MPGILQCVLEGDVFIREFAGDVWAFEVDGGDRWWGLGCDGWLLGWRAVVGVLQDTWFA